MDLIKQQAENYMDVTKRKIENYWDAKDCLRY
jgi:hypothetical protein